MMELELNRDHADYYDMVLNTETSQEETLETIVPDACPDIMRIADVGGQICLHGKAVQEGSVTMTGHINVWVLYQPEEGGSLCRMEVKLPFTARAESAQVRSNGIGVVRPVLRTLDARALNPRKILVRADLCFEVQVFEPKELDLCREITCAEDAGLQQLTTEHSVYMTACVKEKDFTFSDEIRLTSGPSGTAQVLGVKAEAWCTESKVIGNKLIFKGDVVLQTRYQVDGELCCMRCPLAFSQIMEIPNVGQNADCALELYVIAIDTTQLGEDGRTLSVTAQLLAQAVVSNEWPTVLLQDVYSTRYQLSLEQGVFSMPQLLGCGVHPQSVREVLQTQSVPKSVINAEVSVFGVSTTRETDQLVLTAQLQVTVLYYDEQDVVCTASHTITASGRLDAPANASCHCSCRCPGELYATPVSGGVEVRFNLEFYTQLTETKALPIIQTAKLGQEYTASDGAVKPSIVLRMAQPEERLWDIAKAYATTGEHIMQANHMESDMLPAGQILLIPRVR